MKGDAVEIFSNTNMNANKRNSFYNRAQSLQNQKIDTGRLQNEKIYAQYGLLGKK